MIKTMGMDTKTALSIYVVAQLVTFGLFIYLMTTVNPKQTNDHSNMAPLARESTGDNNGNVIRLLRKNNTGMPSAVNATAPENITKTINKKQKLKSFRRKGISSDNDEVIMNTPVILPNSHALCPLHGHGKDMVAIISNSSAPFLHHTEDNICNKSSCVYRLVTTDKELDHDIMHQIRFGRLFPPVHGKHPVKGFRRSLKDSDIGEIDKDTVLLKFLGIDHDGAPMIEIRVGPNLIIANPLSGGDASLIKWVPYTADTSSNTVVVRNETDREIDKVINNSLSEIELTNVTEDFLEHNTNTTNVTKFFTEVLKDVKNLITTRLIPENYTEFNENLTVSRNYSTYHNDTDLLLEIEADPHKNDSSHDYEINFGSSSEFPIIINRSEPKLQPDVPLFLLNSTTESLLNVAVENVTETTAGNITSLPSQNGTNDIQSFNSINVEMINVSEKRKNISISIVNNTLVNDERH